MAIIIEYHSLESHRQTLLKDGLFDMKNIHYDNFQILFNNLEIHMLEHGHLYADNNWTPKEVRSPFNRLYFIFDGEGYLLDEDMQRVPLKKGFIYLIPINSTYHYRCDEYMEKFYIHFNLEYLPGHDLFSFNQTCTKLPMDVIDIKALMKMAEGNDITDHMLFKCRLLELLSLFSKKTEVNYSQINTYIKYNPIFEYVQKNCYITLDVAQIADAFGMNPNTLRINFKKDMGITLKKYIDLKLLGKIQNNLIYSNQTLKEISYEYRFSDEFYLSRFFKKYTGISPKQYKINHFINNIHAIDFKHN